MLNNLPYEFHGKQNRSPTVIGSGFFLQFISAITPVKYMYQWNIEIAERRITQVSKYIPKVASYVFELSWLTSVVINSSLRWSSGVFFLVCPIMTSVNLTLVSLEEQSGVSLVPLNLCDGKDASGRTINFHVNKEMHSRWYLNARTPPLFFCFLGPNM